MVIDHIEGSGDWYEAWRPIALMHQGWVRGVQIQGAMARVKMKANAADREGTKGTVSELAFALEQLEQQCDIYIHQARALRDEVNAFAAAVQAQHAVHVDPATADNGIPLEDDLLERMSDLYGLAKPKPRR